MKIAYSLEEFRGMRSAARHAVTIGNFDGVHLGHKELIRITQKKAALAGGPSVLVTFDPHPVHVVRGIENPDNITPLPRKMELLAETGIDFVIVLAFTQATAAMSAADFVQETLVNAIGTSDLVTGYNFALGKDREGSLARLRELGETHRFSVTQVPPVVVGQETVSSSLVREHIRCGEMRKATNLLGRMHSVDGEVIHGNQRGRTIGYPTANVRYGNTLLPPLGAYATWARVEGEPAAFMSMTSVGTNPTFGGKALSLETHIFDFSDDVYGKTLRVFFAERLRGEIAFDGAQALKKRLAFDEKTARDVLDRRVKTPSPGPLHFPKKL